MKKKDLIKILEKFDDEMVVVLKDYSGSSDLWKPKQINYVEVLKQANQILIN